MSYGLSITNNNGETVIDDTNSCILVESVGNYNGSSPYSYHGVGTGWFYDGLFPSDALSLIYMPVGSWLVRLANQPQRYVIGASSVTVLHCKFAKDVTLANGYGMRVFDANGNVTYDAGEKLVQFKNVYNNTTNNAGFGWSQTTQGSDYYNSVSADVAINCDGPFGGQFMHCGFKRTGTNTISGVGLSEGYGPCQYKNSTIQVLEAG